MKLRQSHLKISWQELKILHSCETTGIFYEWACWCLKGWLGMAGQSGFPEERGQSESAKLCFPVPAFPSLIKNTSERNVEMRNGNNSNSTSRDMGAPRHVLWVLSRVLIRVLPKLHLEGSLEGSLDCPQSLYYSLLTQKVEPLQDQEKNLLMCPLIIALSISGFNGLYSPTALRTNLGFAVEACYVEVQHDPIEVE